MLHNYLTVALRNLARNRVYAAINVVGLAVAIACALLIAEFVIHEWTFDRVHSKSSRIYRVVAEDLHAEVAHWRYLFQLSPHLGADWAERVSGVEAATHVLATTRVVRAGEGEALGQKILFVDPSFIELFDVYVVEGDLSGSVTDPYSAAVTRSAARRLLGDGPVIGKVLVVGRKEEETSVTVRAVVEDPPTNSSQQFDLLLPVARVGPNPWGSMRGLWVLLESGVSPASVVPTIEGLVLSDLRTSLDKERVHLQGLTDIHFDNRAGQPDFAPRGRPEHSYILAGLAALILLTACINYANLALAQVAHRRRELGVRKVVGAGRRQIRGQLLGEALVLTTGAIAVGVGLAELALPLFNELVERDLVLRYARPATWGVGAALLVLVGLAAGWYPAATLSRLQATVALQDAGGVGRGTARRWLVVAQFALAVFLVATTVAMRNQLEYVTTTDLGWDADHVVLFRGVWGPQADLLRESLEREEPAFVAAAGMFPVPGGWGWAPPVPLRAVGGELKAFEFQAGSSVVAALGLRLRAGRGLEGQPAGSGVALINEALAARLGLADPLGAELALPEKGLSLTVIGVVEDFHFGSLHSAVEPAFLRPTTGDGLVVRFHPNRVEEGIEAAERAWAVIGKGEDRMMPQRLGEWFDSMYADEQRWAWLVSWLASFAMGISCLGLFGLAGFVASRRTKEIGVRKVLGATTGQLLVLLYGQFGRLAGVACVVGWAASWWVVQRWLQSFAYRAEPGVAVFGTAAAVALAAAAASVSWQALAATRANPVDALRCE